MRILFVANSTINTYLDKYREVRPIVDSSTYNFYNTLSSLGHVTYFYDTVNPREIDFNKVVDEFNPNLIFCIFTGNKNITPYEPLEEIRDITNKGGIKTFNWFCDDTWRFESFSSKICNNFTVCSTPEPSYIEKYRDIGYKNILIGQWHVNKELSCNLEKKYNIGFCGGINSMRHLFFNRCKHDIHKFTCESYNFVIYNYSLFKIGICPSFNANDSENKTQFKLRFFEIPAANSLLVAEYHKDIDLYYNLDDEIITYTSIDELNDKLSFYLENDSERERISYNGYNRYLRDHTSQVRLKRLLEEIERF